MKNVVIIGGGASGLMAAISAGKSGAAVTVLEKNDRPGKKLMITGKGRCNVTNNSDNSSLIKNTVHGGKFLYSAFSAFSSQDTISFFENCGVPLKTERGNRVFPVSDKAVSIVYALTNEAQKYAKIEKATADKFILVNGKITAVKSGSKIYPADSVIIATGGKSYPLTGSTGDGYALAQSCGHTVTPLFPSLIGLRVHEGFCTALSGLSLKNVTLSLFQSGKKKPIYKELGEMLFTHTGISGPLCLTASALIGDISKNDYYVSVDLKPALSAEQLDKRILRDFSENSNKDFINSLSALLPKSLVPVIVKLSGIPGNTKVNQISKTQRETLVSVLKNLTLHITGFEDFDSAVVTRGGVSLKEINPSDMQSKIVPGLFFAGEVMDVDALTGGFNLQIAFSTGYLAGINAAK